jgi:predicted nucleic acid-binding protein
MPRVLLDASFWIALRDPREPWHGRARQATLELLKSRTLFVFTTLILAETHAYFSRSPAISAQILDDAERNPTLHWEAITPSDEAEAIRLLRTHRDKSYSLCDAVSFALMRRLALRRAAALDEHFRQFGEFEIIPEHV